jgi:hypothetical protein
MASIPKSRLIDYLHTELALPSEDIALAMRHQTGVGNYLPVILWQYGLVSLSQLNSIFDWLEAESVSPLSEI